MHSRKVLTGHRITQTISVEITEPVTHRVTVGTGGEYLFEPAHINADVGEKIVFEFKALNHTLTQSSLIHPCTSLQQLDSGFKQFNPTDREDLMLSVTVNTLEPQWFFCRQNVSSSHCHAGMVFAVNPGEHMDEFLANVRRESALGISGAAKETQPPVMSRGFAPSTGWYLNSTGVFPTGVFPTGVFPTTPWHTGTGAFRRSAPSPSQPPPEAFTSSGNNKPRAAFLLVALMLLLAKLNHL
ncbi:hypothetical protein I7I51_05349 [Histoplasma capsulatum]|uniref:Cupredoxin n=1 Tax=Ajellomyces capsulatus TaxID=5037 RepID=A0A8A1M3B7_AJECA|nr:hypothetical protein I7I51_05349 [Histoplasma capsulatum]